jgi:hypothetical protein
VTPLFWIVNSGSKSTFILDLGNLVARQRYSLSTREEEESWEAEILRGDRAYWVHRLSKASECKKSVCEEPLDLLSRLWSRGSF